MLVSSLIPVDLSDAALIFPKLGTKNALGLLDGLAMRKLNDVSAETLMSLTTRVSRINTKRNILVHGHWVLEANVLVRRGEAYLATQFLREVIPSDPKDAQAMANPRNQKERVRYTFTLKRIDGVTRDTNALNQEICEFMQGMRRKTLPLSDLLQSAFVSKPYRVNLNP
jgi:hypothetical protein